MTMPTQCGGPPVVCTTSDGRATVVSCCQKVEPASRARTIAVT